MAIDSSLMPIVETVQAVVLTFNNTIKDLNTYGTVKMSLILSGLADISDKLEPKYSETFRMAVDISV